MAFVDPRSRRRPAGSRSAVPRRGRGPFPLDSGVCTARLPGSRVRLWVRLSPRPSCVGSRRAMGLPVPLRGPAGTCPRLRSGPMLDGRNKTPRRGEGSLARDQRHARRRGPTYRAGHARDDLDRPGNVMPTDVVAIAAGRDRAHDLGAAGEDRCCAPSRPAAGRPVLRTPRPLRHRGRVLCARRRALGTGRWPIGVGASAGGGTGAEQRRQGSSLHDGADGLRHRRRPDTDSSPWAGRGEGTVLDDPGARSPATTTG